MKKRALTLIEIMIVILLITMIGGAIGYNVKGSLNRGREFKTEQAQQQLSDLLDICLQDGIDPEKILKEPEKYLRELGLAKDPRSLLKDGWGKPFIITLKPNKKEFDVKVDKS